MKDFLRKMTAFHEEDRPQLSNSEIFNLKEYQQLMNNKIDLTQSVLYNHLGQSYNQAVIPEEASIID